MFTDFTDFFLGLIKIFLDFIAVNLLTIQITSFLISSVLLGLTIFFISKTDFLSQPIEHLFEVFGKANKFKTRIIKGWKEIRRRLKSGKPDDLKLAVVEADKILDDILRLAGYAGRDLDECLEQMPANQFSNFEELKQAHKFSVRIVNEPGFVISLDEAKTIIGTYKKAFQELNLIE